MLPVNYPTPTGYKSTGPDIECAEITQLQEGRTNLPRRKMPKMVKNGKEWSKTSKNGANLCKTSQNHAPSGVSSHPAQIQNCTKWHEMALFYGILNKTDRPSLCSR